VEGRAEKYMRRLLIVFFMCLLWGFVGIRPAEAEPATGALQDQGGFPGIPWGAGLEQIDPWMTERGFSDKKILNHGNAVQYRGNFNGNSEYVVLSLWNNQLYEATASGICQIKGKARRGELRDCFSRLETMFALRYGPPTRKIKGEESQIRYWTKFSDPPWKREELNLMLSMHAAEGGLTEGSVQVRLVNRSLEHILFARGNDSTLIERPSFVAYSAAADEQGPFSHEAASLVLAQKDKPAIFWLKLTPRQAGLEQLLAARLQSGLETGRFAEVEFVLCKAAVLSEGFIIEQQIYFDTAGEVIADWSQTDWEHGEQPGALVANQAQAILPHYFSIKNNNLPSGFAGISWGASPDTIPGAMQDETLAKVLRIYAAYVDVSPLLGEVPQVKKDWLVFHRERGLQRGVINFDGRYYEQVLQRLTDLLGNPRWQRGHELYWQVAEDLKIEIIVMPAFGKLHGSLHVMNPQYSAHERTLFRRPYNSQQ